MKKNLFFENERPSNFDIINSYIKNNLKGESYGYLMNKISFFNNIKNQLSSDDVTSAIKKNTVINFFKSLEYYNENYSIANYIILLYFLLSLKNTDLLYIKIMILKKSINAIIERVLPFIDYEENNSRCNKYMLNINFIDSVQAEVINKLSLENTDEIEFNNIKELFVEMKDFYVMDRYVKANERREKEKDTKTYLKYFQNPVLFYNKYKEYGFSNVWIDYDEEALEVNASLFETCVAMADYEYYKNRLNEDNMILEGLGTYVRKGMDKIHAVDRQISNSIDDMVDNIRDKSIKERRKKRIEEILRGKDYGMKLSSLLKRAIGIAGAAMINPALGVLTAIGMYFNSKNADKREKWIMRKKLMDELEMVDEKIKDAESEGNKKEKYELMRLRKKMQNTIDAIEIGASPAVFNN